MRRLWKLRVANPGDVARLADALGLSSPVARVLVHRGLDSPEAAGRFLRPALDDLTDPFALPDMARAADRVALAVRRRERILVHGDYDVDGMIGTALLLQFLRGLGADADYHIPDRTSDGYSIRDAAVDRALSEGFGLVVSVDNGTGAVDAIARLQAAGVDVIVTDHHVPGERLAPAHAVVNPLRAGKGAPGTSLCGAGVAFKLAWAVAERLSPQRRRSPAVAGFLHDALAWVAIATLADMAPLDAENRALVRFGLGALRATTNPGLLALVDSANLRGRFLGAEEVTFRIAPRLNAAGRLGQHGVALECLTATSLERALACAKELDRLNARRQRIDRETMEGARAILPLDLAERAVLLLGSADWHPGVIGLSAARLAEEFDLPVGLVALRGDRGRGSMRGPVGVHLPRLLASCADLLEEHGGHAQAAGFEVRTANLDRLRERLDGAVRLAGRAESTLAIDGELPLSALTPSFHAEIARLAPFGAGNDPPVFAARAVEVLEPARRAPRGEQVLTLRDRDTIRRAVARAPVRPLDPVPAGASVAIAYTPTRGPGSTEGEIRLHDLVPDEEFAFVA